MFDLSGKSSSRSGEEFGQKTIAIFIVGLNMIRLYMIFWLEKMLSHSTYLTLFWNFTKEEHKSLS